MDINDTIEIKGRSFPLVKTEIQTHDERSSPFNENKFTDSEDKNFAVKLEAVSPPQSDVEDPSTFEIVKHPSEIKKEVPNDGEEEMCMFVQVGVVPPDVDTKQLCGTSSVDVNEILPFRDSKSGLGEDGSVVIQPHKMSTLFDRNQIPASKMGLECQSYIETFEEEKSLCTLCNRGFKRNSHLIAHMRTHSEERPFPCNHCDKSFKRKGCLARHMQIHSGERPYICNQCNKSFKDRSNLLSHTKIHSGERHFICLQCNMTFIQRTHLTKHTRIHTGERPFTCHHCNMNFITKHGLKAHMHIHSGEKPFTCPLCFKSFPYNYSLQSHLRVHTGERPYKCKHCSKAFKDSSHRTRHMKGHSQVES